MPVAQFLAGESGRGQTRRLRVDPQFLVQFSDQRRFGRFLGFHLAARKFPQPRHAPSRQPLLHEHPAIGIDQRHGNDKEQGSRSGAVCLITQS